MLDDTWKYFKRVSTGEIVKLKYVGNHLYVTEDRKYKNAGIILKYYESVNHIKRAGRVITPNGFKVQLTKKNYANFNHLKRSTPNAKKQKSHDQHMGEETNANQDGLSEGI
jgi:hypothetical protein